MGNQVAEPGKCANCINADAVFTCELCKWEFCEICKISEGHTGTGRCTICQKVKCNSFFKEQDDDGKCWGCRIEKSAERIGVGVKKLVEEVSK